jgi:hypothetical protein
MKGDIVYPEERKVNAEQADFLYPDVNNRWFFYLLAGIFSNNDSGTATNVSL